MKLLIFLVVGYLIYYFFFRGGKITMQDKESDSADSETMVECSSCKTYISIKESKLIGDKRYCKECKG